MTFAQASAPNLESAINYWDGNVPEFKNHMGVATMKSFIFDTGTTEDNRFKTISDFKESMLCGGEVVFRWKDTEYGAFRIDDSRGVYCVSVSDGERMKWYNDLDDLLQYTVGSDRLRDIITRVTVLDRTL